MSRNFILLVELYIYIQNAFKFVVFSLFGLISSLDYIIVVITNLCWFIYINIEDEEKTTYNLVNIKTYKLYLKLMHAGNHAMHIT